MRDQGQKFKPRMEHGCNTDRTTNDTNNTNTNATGGSSTKWRRLPHISVPHFSVESFDSQSVFVSFVCFVVSRPPNLPTHCRTPQKKGRKHMAIRSIRDAALLDSYSTRTQLLLGSYWRPTPILPCKTVKNKANSSYFSSRKIFSCALRGLTPSRQDARPAKSEVDDRKMEDRKMLAGLQPRPHFSTPLPALRFCSPLGSLRRSGA
jgi:hypothetical protein